MQKDMGSQDKSHKVQVRSEAVRMWRSNRAAEEEKEYCSGRT
jgi:hypothetical protein